MINEAEQFVNEGKKVKERVYAQTCPSKVAFSN